jgi:membrane protease YdiL (CAAX protease family)
VARLVLLSGPGWVALLRWGPVGDWVQNLSKTEGGSILEVFLNLILWVVVVSLLVRPGRFGLDQLGLGRADFPKGLLATAAVWVVLQVAELLAVVLVGDSASLRLSWLTSTHGLVPFLVGWVSVALGEEVFFRGFLQNQLVVKLGSRRAASAVFLASMAFALAHLPRLLIAEEGIISNLLVSAMIGFAVGAVYYVSGNLYLCVGLHALFNWPVLLFDEAVNHNLVLGATTFVYVAIVLARHGTPSVGPSAAARQRAELRSTEQDAGAG